jgi:hypothetical protein
VNLWPESDGYSVPRSTCFPDGYFGHVAVGSKLMIFTSGSAGFCGRK